MTPFTQRLLTVIRTYIEQHGVAPTYAQMRDTMGGTRSGTRSGVHRGVVRLVDEGLLVRVPGVVRGLRLANTVDLAAVPTAQLRAELERRANG